MKVPSKAKMSATAVAGNTMGGRGSPAGGRAPGAISGKMMSTGIAGSMPNMKGKVAGGMAPGSMTSKLPKGKA